MDTCEHGFTDACAECRDLDALRAELDGLDLPALRQRRTETTDRLATLSGYAGRGSHMTQSQRDELGRLAAEQAVIGGAIDGRELAARRDELAVIARAAQDPVNRERGDGGAGAEYAPDPRTRTLRRVRGNGTAVQRSRRLWDDLNDGEFRYGSMVSRAYDALDSYDDGWVSRAGRERVAELFADGGEEQAAASRLAVALADPAYASAYRTVMGDPVHGSQFWSREERDAAARVNQLMRSASLATGSVGWALPLDLDPAVRLVNGGSANPWRELSTLRTTTSNFKRILTSSGASAAWLGEAAVATDGTPVISNVDITPVKAAAWLFGSYEAVGWTQGGSDGDIDFASNLSTFLTDAKDQLEVAAFATGATGTGQPTGLLTAVGTASDLTLGTGAWTMTGVAAIKEAVAPRFRLGPGAKTAWLASLAYLDKTLQIPQFTGALTALVDSSGPIPRMLQAPMYECSAMATATGAGTRVLMYGDFSQNYVVDRWPGFTLFEPMLKGTGANANLPTGQSGWFYVWRTGMGQTTTGAFRVGKN